MSKPMPEIIKEIEQAVADEKPIGAMSEAAIAEIDREQKCVSVLTAYIYERFITVNTREGVEPEVGTKTLFRRIAAEQALKFYRTYRLEEYLKDKDEC